MRKIRVTLVQNNAGADPARNLARIRERLAGTPAGDLVVLPAAGTSPRM